MDRSSHEQMVREFFDACEIEDPDRYGDVCDTYPVLTRRQIRYRLEHEMPVSQLRGDYFRHGIHDQFYSSQSRQEMVYDEPNLDA